MTELIHFWNRTPCILLDPYIQLSLKSYVGNKNILIMYMVSTVNTFCSYQVLFQNSNKVCYECRSSSFQVWKIKALQTTRIIISISNTCTFFVRWWTIKFIFTSIALNSSITSFTWALTVIETIFTFWTNHVTVASSKIEKDLSYLLGNPYNTENWLMEVLFRCEKLYVQLRFNLMNHSTWVSWKKTGVWG